MSKKAYKTIGESFEHTQGKNKDSFIRIFHDMRNSQSWKDLTLRQRGLYVEMKAKYDTYTVTEGVIVKGSRLNFNFPKVEWQKLYGKSNTSWLTDKAALISHGFIKQIESGQNSRTKSVYQYSDKWKVWTKENGIPQEEKKACENNTKNEENFVE